MILLDLFLYMKQINIKDIKEYTGQYFYFKQENIDTNSHIIFKLISVDNDVATIEHGYLFNIPKANWTAFLYTLHNNQILLNTIQKIYVLSTDEYINTYRMFFKYDKCLSNQLPSKIIQDNII